MQDIQSIQPSALQAMRPLSKAGLVIAGYVAAFLVAWVVVAIYIAVTDGVDRQTYSGMSAFGDSLLFVGVFGIAAVPATGAALYFLRPYRPFWVALSVGSLAVAATGLASLVTFVVGRAADSHTLLNTLATLAVLRMLLTLPAALVFFLSGLFAPTRSPRIALFIATFIEVMVFGGAVLLWLNPFRS